MSRPSRRHLGTHIKPTAASTTVVARIAAIAATTAVVIVAAADPAWAAGLDEGPTQQLEEVLDNARNWLVGILGAVALVLLTIAGIRYSLGAASPSETEKAKAGITAVLIGLAIAFLAPTIVGILRGILGV